MTTNHTVFEPAEPALDRAVVFAENYMNKLSAEAIGHECRRRLDAGCRLLELNFSRNELINSIGISVLLDVIDRASAAGARVVLTEVRAETVELFEMLGVTRHVSIE